jgi:hypothetical protein
MKSRIVWIAAAGAGALTLAYLAGTHDRDRPSGPYGQGSPYPTAASTAANAGTYSSPPPGAAADGVAAPAAGIATAAGTSGLDQASAQHAIEHLYDSQSVEWHSIQIGQPRAIAPSDAAPLEIPGGTNVYPVLASISVNSSGTIRDMVQTYFVYQDAFGSWVAAPYPSSENKYVTRGEYGH